MPLTYADALDFLFPRTTAIKFGLDTTRALLRHLGEPQRHFACVHVGGTNGKGSVSTLVAEALAEAGWRVGLYTSPHLVSFQERIRVDGVPIGERAVAMWTEELRPLVIELGATFFEATTAIAFADFAARGVEVAVVEVGLGGRLDSTNVVEPLASAVTKIERDHMKYLGNTLERIAVEKAGIAKPGVPFVVGETRPRLVEVLRREATRIAHEAGTTADVRVVPANDRWTGPLALHGAHQRRNAAVARALLEALPPPYRPGETAIARGFARARIPGRFDRRGKWLFDVAHNPDGMRALVAALRAAELPRPIHALVSILGDKEWPAMLVTLDAAIDRGVLTIAPTAAGRRWDTAWLTRWLREPHRPPARAAWSLVPDFAEALGAVQEGAGTVLVTGSFHTVGDVMRALGMEVA
ncbi:MAG TPA: Mur ligase family protein [Gemmatimonadales bacterium]|nr:Mur ligase family protein [Gemmatimonadales bacterium]